MATAVATNSLGAALTRLRVPLIALAVVVVAIDSIGLGLDWARAVTDTSSAADRPSVRTQVTAPSPVVTPPASSGSAGTSTAGSNTTPLIGPPVVAAPPASSPSTGTNPPPNNPATPTPAVPLAQLDLAVPMLGVQASLGLGDNSCTTVNLTVLALGDCPTPDGDGPIILHLGGSLLGQ